MDLATIIGIIFGAFVVGLAIFLGGEIGAFVDVPSVLIVVGGASAATLVRFPLANVASALILGGKTAFTHRRIEPHDLINEIAELADVARKQGPLGLEGVEVDHEFLAKGVQYIADGYDHDFIRESLERERDLMLERLQDGQRIFKAIGDAAPAFGMIGTLVGLVAMLANMDDPSKIGPSMAIALLTTLYGAIIANLVCLPVADKLELKSKIEDVNLTLILDGVMQLRDSKSPNLVKEMLISYLPEKGRAAFAEASA
ncbi:motility protein A [Tepidamorphus sp. 3E244]|uniref:motility protein A n=1 Tax=Tepidamorphus sp. 3E244 TaxID=3385498 RepID=UPI0038FCCC5C